MDRVETKHGQGENNKQSIDESFQSMIEVEGTSNSSDNDNGMLTTLTENLTIDESRHAYNENFTQNGEYSDGSTTSTTDSIKGCSENDDIIPNETSESVSELKERTTDENLDSTHLSKFDVKYHPSVEQVLYPNFYQKFKLQGNFIVQRTGSNRSVCLTCCRDLMVQRNDQNLLGHLSGQKHMGRLSAKSCISVLKNYHENFYKLEPNLQAHQVYFLPDANPNLNKCILCMLLVKRCDIVAHILSDMHKHKTTSLKNDHRYKSTFYLLEMHVKVYGVHFEREKNVPIDRGSKRPGPNEKPKRIFMSRVKSGGNEIHHEIVKSVVHPNHQNLIHTLPRRFAPHLSFLSVGVGNTVNCIACKNGNHMISNLDIQLHLAQGLHLKSTKLKFPNYTYFCEICNKRFYTESKWIDHFRSIPKKHQGMAAFRKEQVSEHECLTCQMIIYGDILSLRRHQNNSSRWIENKRETLLPQGVSNYFISKSKIIQNGVELLEVAETVRESQEDKMKCCIDLEKALSSRFPDCKAYFFGSRVSGLGSRESDLDVFIDVGGMYTGLHKQEVQDQFEIIKTSMDLFKRVNSSTETIFYKISSRPTARTPIIRLKHKPSELDCDISFRHGLSTENTKFLRFCFELQPSAQNFMLLLKKWLHLCFLTENITTYAMAMMAVFYLQTKNYLISVKTLRELNPEESVIIDGWETIAYTAPIEEARKRVKMCDEDIVDLLKGFFKYYSRFDFKNNVICPLLGETVLKRLFNEDSKGGKLPKEMASYIRKINSDESPEYFKSLAEMCLQDPFDLNHNLTKACSFSVVEKFKTLCALSLELINNLRH